MPNNSTHLLRDPWHSLLLVDTPAIPLRAQRVVESSFILRDRGVRVWQILDLKLPGLLVLLLGDDDVVLSSIFAFRGFDTSGRLEELGIGLALLYTFTAPGALNTSSASY